MAQLVLFASPALDTTESTLRSGHCLSSKLHSQHLSILLQETYFLLVVDSTGVPNWSAVDSQKVNSLVLESHSLEGNPGLWKHPCGQKPTAFPIVPQHPCGPFWDPCEHCPVTLGGTAVMLGHCAKPGAQLRNWLSTKLGAAACGHWPCCIACCCCCCCCPWHELRFCAACLAPKPGKPEPSLRSGELSDDVLGGNLVLYPCSTSLVTSACNPWDIPGPFCCILNLHLTRPRSTQLRYHVKIQRPKLPTRRNAKTLGSAARAKNPTTQLKKLFHSNTQSVSQVPTFAPANRRKQQSLSLFPVLLLWLLFEPSLAPLSLLEMKNVRMHTHLCLNVLWHSRAKKKTVAASSALKLPTAQTHRKLICTNWLFVFDLFQKKNVRLKLRGHAKKN